MAKLVSFLYRVKAYFSHGHGNWTGFMVSIGTFLMVLYSFGYDNFLFFRTFFGNPIVFLLVAMPSYIIVAGLIGYWSYKRGAFAARASIEWKQNPEYMEMKADLKEIRRLVEESSERIGRDI